MERQRLYRGQAFSADLLARTKVEFAVFDEDAQRLVNSMIEIVHPDNISILRIEEAISVDRSNHINEPNRSSQISLNPILLELNQPVMPRKHRVAAVALSPCLTDCTGFYAASGAGSSYELGVFCLCRQVSSTPNYRLSSASCLARSSSAIASILF